MKLAINFLMLIGVVIVTVVFAIFLVEWIKTPHPVWGNHQWNLESAGAAEIRSLLGYGGAPNDKVIARKVVDGSLIYDVEYNFNKHGWRRVPKDEPFPEKTSVLFLGGSIAFSEGVGDENTIAFELQKSMSGTSAYIYAFPGYGPNHSLRLLQGIPIKEQISTVPKHGLYLFIPDHRHRVSGTDLYYRWNRLPSPVFALDGDIVRYSGKDTEVRPWLLRRFLRFWGLSGMGLNTRLHWPDVNEPAQKALFCGVVRTMKDQFTQLFPKSRFHVVLVPEVGKFSDSLAQDCLIPAGVSFLDLRSQPDLNSPVLRLAPGIDEHFNELGSLKLAHKIRAFLATFPDN